jgi:hypothetical protein
MISLKKIFLMDENMLAPDRKIDSVTEKQNFGMVCFTYASFLYAGNSSYLRECSYVFNEVRPRREMVLIQ